MNELKFNLALIILVALVEFIIYCRIEISRKRDLLFHYPLQNDSQSTASIEIETREKKDKKFLQRAVTGGLIIIIWQGIWVPTSNFNTDKLLAADQKTAYIAAYENGWTDQCEALFGRLGGISNYIYGQKLILSYPQCVGLKSGTSAFDAFDEKIGGFIRDSSEYEMSQLGRNQANRDVLNQVFLMSPYWCYGIDCLSGQDFGIYTP